jgi:23S rRNA pseudouridine1911/1915/1917 synthase
MTEISVPVALQGQRIDVVLAQLFPDFSRAKLTQWLKSGAIKINDCSPKPKDKVCGFERITLTIPTICHPNDDEPENMPLDIVFEDAHLLVINKPAGLIVHPGAGNPKHTLVNALLYHDASLAALPRAGIVHRLDKDTTGLLLIAKTLPVYTNLVRQMQTRAIQRHYITLVRGHVIGGKTIETCFGRDPHNRLKMAVCANGKEAVTRFTIRQHYHYFTLLDVALMTGRTHQIRVHMTHINHPVVGDKTYHKQIRYITPIPETIRPLLQAFKRQALHAHSLSFLHPVTDAPLTLTAPLPDDFASLLTAMDNHHD